MPLTKLQFRPGINRETTSYTNEGGWYDGDHIRFRFGFPEKIGGWRKATPQGFIGSCRSLHAWTDLSGGQYTGIGTSQKFYVQSGDALYDITPIRHTTAAGDVTFSVPHDTLASAIDAVATAIALVDASDFPPTGRIKIDDEVISYAEVSGNTLLGCVRGAGGTTAASHLIGAGVGCSTITVTDLNHGCILGSFVTFSGAAALGGAMTADVLNQEYYVIDVIDGDTYLIFARQAGTSLCSLAGDIVVDGSPSCIAVNVFSTAADTGTGGASTVGAYQVNPGLDSALFGTGWGAGPWGTLGWGEAAESAVGSSQLRIWSQDNFGQVLLASFRRGDLYFWDPSSPSAFSGDRLQTIKDQPGANQFPATVGHVLVSDRDRHVIVMGAVPQGGSTYDPLLIRFSDQESFLDWEATATTTAGDLRIGSGSTIVAFAETRQQILILTDVSVHGLQYLGPPFTFGISELAYNTSILGPNAVVNVNDTVFWMGQDDFFVYTGRVDRLPCTVRDYVFKDFNESQREKVYACVNASFGEVWWFYPSANSFENDRYVVYNYQQQVWYYGTMGRTAWLDRGLRTQPLAVGGGYLYDQEFGLDADGAALSAYIESSDVDIGDGDRFAFVRRMIPDLDFRDSTNINTPTVSMSVKVRRFPGVAYSDTDTRNVVRTATVPVDQYTEQVYLRLRGRSFALRVESDEVGTTWRLGSPRLDLRTDGGR